MADHPTCRLLKLPRTRANKSSHSSPTQRAHRPRLRRTKHSRVCEASNLRPVVVSAWHRNPTLTRRGEKRYSVGYDDEDGRQRTKGGFRTRRGAAGSEQWLAQYRVANAQGNSALRQFLDREVRKPVRAETPTLDHITALWLDASNPDLADGLAVATYRSYIQCYRKHVRPLLGSRPITDFERPAPTAEMRSSLTAAEVGMPTVTRAVKVLSACLSWAVENEYLAINGARLTAKSRRRSARPAGSSSRRNAGPSRRSKSGALTPEATAHVVHELKQAPSTCSLNRTRDVTIASFQFLTGCRNQDVFGLRWGQMTNDHIEFTDVISAGKLSPGKVSGSERNFPTNAVLEELLDRWRRSLEAGGIPISDESFVFPGTKKAGHWSESQMKQWGPRRFKPACARASKRLPALQHLEEASPYSLRRGHISYRLRRGDDLAVVARQCGTSVQMLVRHYWRETEDQAPHIDELHTRFENSLTLLADGIFDKSLG